MHHLPVAFLGTWAMADDQPNRGNDPTISEVLRIIKGMKKFRCTGTLSVSIPKRTKIFLWIFDLEFLLLDGFPLHECTMYCIR